MSVKNISILKNTFKYFLYFILSFFLSSCGGNILSEFADKESDPALLKAMQIHTNKFEWDDAISKYSQMSTEFASKREVLVVLASAYAGKCGLRFIELAQNLGGMGVTLLFKFLMQQFPNSTTSNRDDCKLAENAIKSISTDASARTNDENLFMFFLSIAKIGVTLAAHADTVLVDGEPDAGWNSCTDDASNLPDTSAREVGTGLAIALTSLTAVGSSFGGGSSQTTTITALCDALAALDPNLNFCAVTDSASLTADHLRAIRSLIGANEHVGIGSCNDTLANCLCP